MNRKEQILFSRSHALYRTSVDDLSTLFLTKGRLDEYVNERLASLRSLSSYLDGISAAVEALTAGFEKTHPTKDEVKATFSTKDDVSALTSNATYVLSAVAANAISGVSNQEDLSAWYENESEAVYDAVINGGYLEAGNIMNTKPAEAKQMKDFFRFPPSHEMIVAGANGEPIRESRE